MENVKRFLNYLEIERVEDKVKGRRDSEMKNREL